MEFEAFLQFLHTKDSNTKHLWLCIAKKFQVQWFQQLHHHPTWLNQTLTSCQREGVQRKRRKRKKEGSLFGVAKKKCPTSIFGVQIEFPKNKLGKSIDNPHFSPDFQTLYQIIGQFPFFSLTLIVFSFRMLHSKEFLSVYMLASRTLVYHTYVSIFECNIRTGLGAVRYHMDVNIWNITISTGCQYLNMFHITQMLTSRWSQGLKAKMSHKGVGNRIFQISIFEKGLYSPLNFSF